MTNRIRPQYLGSHLYFQYFRTESPDGDALVRAREGVNGKPSSVELVALIKGRSPATYTSDAPSE